MASGDIDQSGDEQRIPVDDERIRAAVDQLRPPRVRIDQPQPRRRPADMELVTRVHGRRLVAAGDPNDAAAEPAGGANRAGNALCLSPRLDPVV